MSDSLTLAGVAKELPEVIADIAKLQNPVLSATVVADVLAVVSPFGINVGSSGVVIVSALVAFGTLVTAIQGAIAALKPAPVAKAQRTR